MSVLLIVALATVLVVVASMMAQVERRAAANSAKVEQARGHALFALDVAMGRLQSEAGPDQRISARAEILDDTPSTTNVTSVNQPYWTGIWKTGTNQLDVGSNPQRAISLGAVTPTKTQIGTNAAWLVSGTNANPLTFVGTTNGVARDAIVLASSYGATQTNVTVPLVPIIQGVSTNGAYGYWVSDEGVKAKVSISDESVGISPSANPSLSQVRFLGPQSHAPHKGFPEMDGQDFRADTNLSKVATLASLSNLAGLSAFDSSDASRTSADATIHSFGVLSDVRRAGLKVDLTAGLETVPAFNTLIDSYGLGAQMLYRSASSAGVTVPAVDTGVTPPMDGLYWHNLFVHYNSYKPSLTAPGAVNGSPLTPTGSGSITSLPNVASQRVYSFSQNGTTTKVGGLTPVPVAYRVDIALSSYFSGGTWKLRLHFYPQLVLLNPYAVRLSLANYQFQRNVGAFATAGSYNPPPPTVTSIRISTTTGGNTTTIPYFKVNQASAGRLQLRTKVGEAATMEPGETRVFALDADQTFSTPTNAINFADLVSNMSTTADFSQQCDVLTTVDGNGTSSGAAFTTADPNTIVSVELAAPSLRCQNVDTFTVPNSVKWPWNDGTVRFMAGGDWNLSAASSSWPKGLTISQLNGAPLRLIGFYVRQKGLRTSSSTFNYSNASATVPVFAGNSPSLNPIEDILSFAWQEVYLSPFGTLYTNGQTDVQAAPSGTTLESSFGAESAGVAPPGNRVVLRDVPNQPMVSLGQFMHMPAMNFWSIGNYQSLALGSMFVGGSLASPILQPNANAGTAATGTVSGGGPNNRLYLDDSFLANEALFDRFFFSTVPPQTLTSAAPARWTEFNAANSGVSISDPSKPLLNSRIKLYTRPGATTALADLRSLTKAAANLLVDGAFNINSTSVPAWKAFLGGLSGSDLRLWNATTQGLSTVSSSGRTIIPRFWSAAGSTTANQIWTGARVLDDAELEELAGRIVEQVKTRGPFLSMADFLNRRLGTTAGPLTLSGALQAAIDTTTPDINSQAKASGAAVNAIAAPEANKVPDFLAANMRDGAGAVWNTAIGAPGYLMQQDLVQAFSPSMTARSDTFVVRTYGEVRNLANGRLEGRAWGEAVVQRTPDYVEPSGDSAEVFPPTNANNAVFGRRFRVVSFRWLNENEI